MTTGGPLKVVGTRPIRHDGVDKVTGRASYGADIQLPGLLHGQVLRSPHAHARILSIDASAALALSGVRAVLTNADLPEAPDVVQDLGEGAVNVRSLSDNILASNKVLYKGHAVAAVAATTPHIAEEAVLLIKVQYEVLPPVLDVREAMREDAPLLHEEMRSSSMGGESSHPNNVANYYQFILGDVKRGFADADVVVEREFTTATVHQGYIEPQTATALWKEDGSITIWCSTQGAFTVREQTANILQVPVSQIKVVPMEIGGGFGGKITVYLQPVAVLLSRKTGQPVKLTMSRAEVFEGTGPGAATYINVKIGATKDGTLTSLQASLAYEAGAYPGSPVAAGCRCMIAPYKIENAFVEGYDVVVNKPKTAAYRAPGSPQAAFAAESVIDEVCEQIGMDPIAFRLKNAAREGDLLVDGTPHRKIGCVETLQALEGSPHYAAPLEGPNRGRGMALGYWSNGGGTSSCSINVNGDGTVSLVEGSVDIGGTRVAIAMQAAEVLGLPAEDVHPVVVDTDSVGLTSVTGGSRTAVNTGWAAYEAAQEVVQKMIARAALVFETTVEDVEYEYGVFQRKSDQKHRMSFKELAVQLERTGGPIVGQATTRPRGVGVTFAAHLVDIEMDPETGKVQILRYTATQDVGRAIHPSYVEGQIQGGVAQGVGWALNEEYVFNKDGAMLNPGFLDYRMPTSLDLPMIETILVEVPNPRHPYGARGVGEVPIVPPMAAVANAIHNALGIRLQSLPMSPGHIVKALQERASQEEAVR